MMKMLFWNSRGAGNRRFLRNAKDMLCSEKPSVFAVVEPRISGVKARRMVKKLKFSNHCIADPVGFAGG